jgi:hypothetical protein
MSTPAPRPALKKAADAHIHPAAPGHPAGALRPAAVLEAEAAAAEAAASAQAAGTPPAGARLTGPLRGTTSDSLRAAGKTSRRQARQQQEKRVELTVKVPKSLRKDFRAALKADGKDADEVVTALLRAWLGG